jgi:predicted metal-dependent peptidase
MKIKSEATRRIENQCCQLILDHPFFGVLVQRLRLVECEDMAAPGGEEVKTMATDSVSLFYFPDFVASLSNPVLRTVIAHEVLHCVLGHCDRMADKRYSSDKANIAADYEDNNYLDDFNRAGSETPFPWPEDFQIYLNHDFDGKVMEQIYHLIPDPPPGGNPGDGFGECLPTPGKDEAKRAAKAAEWKVAIQGAAMAQEMKGNMPSSLSKLIKDIFEPELPWKEVLAQFVQDRAMNDFSWYRPNKAFLAHNIIIPALDGNAIGEIVLVGDSSGSIYGSPELTDKFFGEMTGIFEDCNPSKLHFLSVDAIVQLDRTFERGDELELELKGGGGTAFEPAFDWVERNNIEPCCLIYFTDMYGSFPAEPPPYPVLWVSYSPCSEAPFGDVLNVA